MSGEDCQASRDTESRWRARHGRGESQSSRPANRRWTSTSYRRGPENSNTSGRAESNNTIRQNARALDVYNIRARNALRFSDDAQSKPATEHLSQDDNAPPVETSSMRSARRQGYKNNLSKETRRLKQDVIGLGRATGHSRVPDLQLANSPRLAAKQLDILLARVKSLENDEKHLVRGGDSADEGCYSSDATLAEWEEILAQFREITMALTASSAADNKLKIAAYEGAADACLLGGNLAFYLSCQTRLLNELYPKEKHGSAAMQRIMEFIGYSLLYFGVFQVNNCELAQIFRRMGKAPLASPSTRTAFAAILAVQNGDGISFLSLYRSCSVRQKTLMHDRLPLMRSAALSMLMRAYHSLNKEFTLSLLGLNTESEFLKLLEEENSKLVNSNSSSSMDFQLREGKS